MKHSVLILLIIMAILIIISSFFAFSILNENIMELAKTESNTVTSIYFSVKDLFVSENSFILALSIAVLFIVLIFLTIFISRSSFNSLITAINEVSEGDFTVRLPIKGKNKESVLFTKFNMMVKTWGKKIAMQKYVSVSTAKMLENVKTGEYYSQPQRKNVTIFFSDVRGFTSYSEKHDPLIVVNKINELFDIQVQIIAKYNGDIDKFVGDEVMAVFPTTQSAFKASNEIQKKIASYNKKQEEALQIGIGINYGEAIIGAIGSGDSLDWTTIGDVVNLGARLCSFAEGGQICISEDALAKIKTTQKYKLKTTKIKGKKKSVKIYVF